MAKRTNNDVKEALSRQDLEVIVQALANSTIRVADAPRMIDLINKVSRMIEAGKECLGKESC